MAETTQHILVLSIVGLCVGYVLWQALGSFFGRKSKVGSCCSTGCPPDRGGRSAGPAGVHFLPVDMLSRKRKGP